MNEAQATIARRAAQRLAADLGADLPALTERVLAEGGAADLDGPQAQRYDAGLSVAAAAGLIAAAGLAWKIYRDLKSDAQQKAQQEQQQQQPVLRTVVQRRLRVHFGEVNHLSTGQRDQVIEVVVEEIEAELAVSSPPPEQ